MKTVKRFFLGLFFLSLIADSVFAYDFYGASVTNKDTPSSYMRCGIYGNHLVVGFVDPNSPAKKAGFLRGNIILLVNDKPVSSVVELAKIVDDKLVVKIFNGLELKTLTINRLEVEIEKANQLEAERKAAEIKARNREHMRSRAEEQPDESPPLRFDDSMLSKGSTTGIVTESQPAGVDRTPSNAPGDNWSDDKEQDTQGIDW